MSATTARVETVPRPALIAAALLAVSAIALAFVARQYGFGVTRLPDVAVVSAVDVYFNDQPDGAVLVTRAADDRPIGRLAPGSNGFARSMLRGLVRERRRAGIDAAMPFTLTRWADGRLSISDRATGRHIDLDPFGPTNVDVFAKLLISGTR
jgi:putative photosynthetic complex assembly protein